MRFASKNTMDTLRSILNVTKTSDEANEHLEHYYDMLEPINCLDCMDDGGIYCEQPDICQTCYTQEGTPTLIGVITREVDWTDNTEHHLWVCTLCNGAWNASTKELIFLEAEAFAGADGEAAMRYYDKLYSSEHFKNAYKREVQKIADNLPERIRQRPDWLQHAAQVKRQREWINETEKQQYHYKPGNSNDTSEQSRRTETQMRIRQSLIWNKPWYHELYIAPTKEEPLTEEEVNEVIENLKERHNEDQNKEELNSEVKREMRIQAKWEANNGATNN